MTREEELLRQIRRSVIAHDTRGRAILCPSESIDLDVPGMVLSGYGLGAPIDRCLCKYCEYERRKGIAL